MPRGRNAKLTPVIQKAYCRQLETGAHAETAANACGLDPSTVYLWLKRGQAEKEGIYFNFFKAVEASRALVVQKLLKRAHERTKSRKQGGEGADPLPLLAIVDRRYAPQVRVQVTTELNRALDRLQEEFQNEPKIFERILSCLADEAAGDEASAGLAAAVERGDVTAQVAD